MYIELPELSQGVRIQGTLAVGRAIHGGVMPADQLAIGGELDISFYAIGSNCERMGVGGAGMFGVLGAGTTVCENFHGSEPNDTG
ncbi:hypothetical protein GCM10023190_22080 [Enteractinococcus fodinae]